MLDFGWAELFLIMALMVLVIGPNEIPSVMRGLGNLVRRFQYMKYSITRQFDDIMEAGDIGDLQDAVNFEAKRGGNRPDGHEEFDEAALDDDENVVPLSKAKETQDD